MHALRHYAVAGAALVALAGCSKDRVPVSGTVTVSGTPIDSGGIDFVPLDPDAPPGRVGGRITDGRYAIEQPRGPFPGSYRVEIEWMKPTGKELTVVDSGEVSVTHKIKVRAQALPEKYNSKSELTATITRGKNQLDFNLSP